jgi:SIS domain
LPAASPNTHNAPYLCCGTSLPIALEGALKLKEISYIHAEGYAAGAVWVQATKCYASVTAYPADLSTIRPHPDPIKAAV